MIAPPEPTAAVVLDASILIAHLDASDPHHLVAGDVLRTGRSLAVSTVTLAETLVGAVAAGRAGAHRDAIERLGVEEIPLGAGSALLLAQLRAAYGLRMPDCCVLLAGLNTYAAAIATRDRHLREAAGDLGFETP